MTQPALQHAEEVAAYVAGRVGADPGGPRHRELVGRIVLAMAAAGATSAAQFRRRLDGDPACLAELAAALTVGESYFFREPAHLEVLRRHALPERVAARPPEATLRLWSAGCSAGQEAYTLAMVLHEEGLAGRSRVLATDLSGEALERARRGVYGRWSLRALDERRRGRWFRDVPGGFRVDPRLAARIRFAPHNLLDPGGPPERDLDVVLCRNVLVYLRPAAVAEAGRRLVEALAPGGWLVIASTDPRLEGVEGLETVALPESVVYRRAPAGGRRGEHPASTSAAPGAAARRPGADCKPAPARRHPVAPPADAPPTPEPVDGAGADTETEADRGARLVRALGSAGRLGDAADLAAATVARFPLHGELRLLHALVLLEADLAEAAAAAARAVLYLDPALAMGHLTLARADQARGDRPGACRSYRNALALLEAMGPDDPVPLADGEVAGRLAGLARAGLRALGHEPATVTEP